MSERDNDKCEYPSKSWEKYSSAELKKYFIRNMDKCDCSFVLVEIKAEGNEPVLESFQWILREMSTTLEKLLTSDEIKAKNWRLIPIKDPNFETILTFGHTKTIEMDSFDDLINLYESAYLFNIHSLREAILEKLKENDDNLIDWINFFRIAYKTKSNSFYSELYEIFHQRIPKMNIKHMNRELKLKTNMLLNFDPGQFYDFFDAIKSRPIQPLLCFHIVEAYVLKNIFKDNEPIPSQLQGNTTRDAINLFIETIAFDRMSQSDFQNGPQKSVWIDENAKERLAKKYSSQHLRTRRRWL